LVTPAGFPFTTRTRFDALPTVRRHVKVLGAPHDLACLVDAEA
jgi:hypothetical protein